MNRIGVVVIGRNEGERLERCIASVRSEAASLVYVDSGSDDGSPERAKDLGAFVVELDRSAPFTAARARNAGAAWLLSRIAYLEYLQFVDGDCEVRPEWWSAASRHLEGSSDVGVVCGRRRERDTRASIYNRSLDLEWDTPIGDASECGGDAMVRVSAFRDAGGYDPEMIAGEDPEFCLRVRRSGYRIMRLDAEMTWHDARMLHFGQWWRRVRRSGHAYADCVYRHGRGPERFRVRELASIVVWGAGPPILALAVLLVAPPATALLPVAGYGWLWGRVYAWERRRGRAVEDAALYASACTIGKLAQLLGAIEFAWNRLIRNRATRLIEYREPRR